MLFNIQHSLWSKIVTCCFLDLERIKIIYINSNGKNCFRFETNHFSNSLLERIMFDNQDLTAFA